MMLLIRSFLIIFALHTLATQADLSTIERIKKHQEWLRQRGLLKTQLTRRTSPMDDRWKIKEPTKPLWHKVNTNNSNTNNNYNKIDDPRNNDVFPENETTTTKSITSVTTLSSISNRTTTEFPIIPTEKPTTTTLITSTTIEPTSPKSTTNIPSSPSMTPSTPAITTRTTIAEDEISTTTVKTTTTTINSTTASPATTLRPKFKPKPYPRWGTWSQWSACSRTCGGGVMSQQRKCISKRQATGKRYISNDCIGVYRRYHLCNEYNCPEGSDDFRQEQCSAFDDVDFQGRKYTWEPYIKDDAECELNCKPLGMKYFATLNNSVIDGTACFRPAEYYRSNYRGRAICVGGICKAIQSSGVITGLSANSGSVSCGGLICRSITGIFTRNPLPEDAYVHVATIPAGASNISITELKNSINLLVLRTTSTDQKYLFNGDNTESPNGAYDAAGAVFDYRRIDGLQDGEGVTEWITCTGPIREMLELMVYSRDVNPGIKYEYLLPIGSDSEENEVSVESDINLKSGNEDATSGGRPLRKRKFNWKVVGFSPCSKSCGGGTQTPIIRCVRENPTRYFSQRRCSHSEKPVLNENLLRCNTQPCPAFWRVEEWGDCKCQQGEGVRQREIGCVQELASGIVIQVNNVACLEEEPPSKKSCDCPKMGRRRNHHRHRMYNGRLQAPSNSTMPNSQRIMLSDKDKAGVWLMSDWNNHCSAACGPGTEYRSIYCDRPKTNTERCDPRFTPDTTRSCEREIECTVGEWFAGPWSNCGGSCFNLTKTRQVLCIHNQLIVDAEECKAELRPESLQKCSLSDVEYCAPKWHYSEWSECTKTCDGGTQRRHVKCLEVNEVENTLSESIKCRYSKREPIYRSCNTFECSNEPRVDLIQNDIAPTCIDEFNDCHVAVKAKLCSYEYYKQSCCYSCGAA